MTEKRRPVVPGVEFGSVLRRRLSRRRVALASLARTAAGRGRIAILPVVWLTRIAPGHDVADLPFVDRLVLDERLGHLVQLVVLALEDFAGTLVIRVDHAPDFLVDDVA